MPVESLPSFKAVFGDVQVPIANTLNGVNNKQFSEGYRFGKWSEREEKDFALALKVYGIDNITAIQKKVGSRSKSQIRKRIIKVRFKQRLTSQCCQI